MQSELDIMSDAVKSAFARLTSVDGFTTADLADLMGYDNSATVYAITNPTKAQLPPVTRFLMACRRFADLGNTRLARLAVGPRYVLRIAESHVVNGTLDDEQRQLIRQFCLLQDAMDARHWPAAEGAMNAIAIIVERMRSEVAHAKGISHHHGGNGAAVGKAPRLEMH